MEHARSATVSIFVSSPSPQRNDKATFGTGFLISENGYIVTSAHNVNSDKHVSIQVLNQPEKPAEIVGIDPLTDIAVLKIETEKSLPFLRWNAKPVYLGQRIFIIGTPFGLSGSVSAGIVSDPHRALTNNDIGLNIANQVSGFIQTDAAMSLGHSGGPMLNENGEVIGINTAIVSPTEGSVGLGFATPARLSQFIVLELIKYGHVKRLSLGIELQNLSPALADYLKLDRPVGAIISGIDKGGAGYKHGLRVGDLITYINEEVLDSADGAPELVTLNALSNEIELTVLRDQQEQKVIIPITPALLTKNEGHPFHSQKGQSPLSLQVQDITSLDRIKNDIPNTLKGCLVTHIPIDYQKDIFDNSVLLKINDTPVTSANEANQQLQKALEANKPALLHLWINGKNYFSLYPIKKPYPSSNPAA